MGLILLCLDFYYTIKWNIFYSDYRIDLVLVLYFSLSTNDQIAHLIQERDSSQANELVLAERVGELMDEIVKLNDEIAKFKQGKIGKHLQLKNNMSPIRNHLLRMGDKLFLYGNHTFSTAHSKLLWLTI